jgi:transcriptional regulator with XRE-family HTH domain
MAMDAQRREELAARIKELRGLRTQQAIADRVGVTLRAYQAWEAGGGITWENIEALAKAFGVSEDYLLYGEVGDRLRAGTQLERIEAKLDALLTHHGLDLDDLGALTAPHHGSVSELPADERAARAVERPAPRTPAPRRAARRGQADDRSDTPDR